MERRSRSTSVRLSGILDLFTEGKEGQKDQQRASPDSEKVKSVLERKVSLFSFKRRTKSENESTDKNKIPFRPLSETALLPPEPCLKSGSSSRIHSRNADGRFLEQTCKETRTKLCSHTMQKQFQKEGDKTNTNVKFRDKKHLLSNFPRWQAQEVRKRAFSPTERKSSFLDTKNTPRILRLSPKDDDTSCGTQENLSRLVDKEKSEKSDGMSKLICSPVLARDIPKTENVCMESSKKPSGEPNSAFKSLSISVQNNDKRVGQDFNSRVITRAPANDVTESRETESLMTSRLERGTVADKSGKELKHPETNLEDSCSLLNGMTAPEEKLSNREALHIAESKVQPSKLITPWKPRLLALRRLLLFMFISVISLPYCLYSCLKLALIYLGHICKMIIFAAVRVVKSAQQGILKLLSRGNKQYFLPLQTISFIRAIYIWLVHICRSLPLAVKNTKASEESICEVKQDNTVFTKDPLHKKGTIRFSRFIRQISLTKEQSLVNDKTSQHVRPDKLHSLPSATQVEVSNDSVMTKEDEYMTSQKHVQLEPCSLSEAAYKYIKISARRLHACIERLISFALLYLLQLLRLVTRILCVLFTCVRKLIVFVLKSPYLILCCIIKIITVLARVLCMILSSIFSVPVKVLVMLITLPLYIFSTFGKICRICFHYLERKVKGYKRSQEGTHELSNFSSKTNEQMDKVLHVRKIPSLLQDKNVGLENRYKEPLRNTICFIDGPDSNKDIKYESSVLCNESRNVELSLYMEKESKRVMFSPTQFARKLIEFSVDFFCYLFFVALLFPISITAFLKPVISVISCICKIIVPFKEDSTNGEKFLCEDAVIKSLPSETLDALGRPPNISSEFQQIGKHDGKSCKIYRLVNLKRKLKKILKQTLQSEISKNENLESEISINGEDTAERTPSFTRKMEPETLQEELDAEGCNCDPRPYIRRFITFLRISLHMLSIFIATSCYKVNAVLHALLYNSVCVCKVVISFLIEFTPRKLMKWLMIKACQYLPDLKNRFLLLQILRATPSQVTKRLVAIYMRRVPLSLIYLHVQASLKKSPTKKIIRNLAKIWTVTKMLIETIFLSVSTAFKMVSRALKTKRKETALDTKRRSILRLISKDSSDKEIKK